MRKSMSQRDRKVSGRDFNELDALQGLINTVLDIRRPKAHEVGTDNSKPSGDVGHDASAVVDSADTLFKSLCKRDENFKATYE